MLRATPAVQNSLQADSSAMDILMVEDSPGDIRLAQEAFRSSARPINLHLARDGAEAMAFLWREGIHARAPRPDLILLDLNIPKLNGREILKHIKRDIDLKVIPTIILTTSDVEEDVEYCYHHHANCYIRKPEQWDSFDRIVRYVNEFWLGVVQLPGQLSDKPLLVPKFM
jgi:chemotaxis family two-component system response regulator Rcp1